MAPWSILLKVPGSNPGYACRCKAENCHALPITTELLKGQHQSMLWCQDFVGIYIYTNVCKRILGELYIYLCINNRKHCCTCCVVSRFAKTEKKFSNVGQSTILQILHLLIIVLRFKVSNRNIYALRNKYWTCTLIRNANAINWRKLMVFQNWIKSTSSSQRAGVSASRVC